LRCELSSSFCYCRELSRATSRIAFFALRIAFEFLTLGFPALALPF
jgi:hypothetical protein